jgi:beta-lactamase class A
MTRIFITALMSLPFAFSPFTYSSAQMLTPASVLERLFIEPVADIQFSEQFLQAASREQIEQIINQLEDQLGDFETIEGDSNPYTVVFSGGTVAAQIVLDQGVITGLRFTQVSPTVDDLSSITDELAALPGEVSLLVLENGEDVTSLEADTPLAVGSAFKLLVLDVLQAQIDAGQHAWTDVVTLQETWRSLPSGILQDWPEGSALTLETLASLMISQSDNTATDALIDLVGKEALEQATTDINQPFLTTRDFFVLKATENSELLEQFQNADTAGKRAFLTDISQRDLPSADILSGAPVALDIEWFFSARELCDLMANVQDIPLTTINPGVANPDNWQRVAYKGGSEPGVLSLVTWLENANNTYCVALTQNNPEATLDTTELFSIYGGILAYLARQE